MVTPGKICFLLVVIVQASAGENIRDCYNGCKCISITAIRYDIVNCTKTALHGIPSKLFSKTYMIIISHDYIPIIKTNTFFYKEASTIHILSLQKNNVTTLEKFAFSGLNSLEVLYLNHNKIKMIGPNCFQGLDSIVKLGLRDNMIETIHNDAFKNLKHLETLILAVNHLQILAPDLLYQNTKLFELTLCHNMRLTLPQKEPFLISKSLKVLNMSTCGLQDITSKTFQGMPNLQHIDVANNYLINITYSFHNLTNLTYLNFEDNVIETVREDAFYALPNLRVLNLSGNRIKSLHPDTFHKNTKLIFINLSFNILCKLHTGLFFGLNHLMEIDLSLNPLLCDCHIQAIYSWSRHQNVTVEAACTLPDGSYTYSWDTLGEYDCEAEHPNLQYHSNEYSVMPSDLQNNIKRLSSWNMYILITVCTLIFILLAMLFAFFRSRCRQMSTPRAYDVSAAIITGGNYYSYPMGEVTSVNYYNGTNGFPNIRLQTNAATRNSRSAGYYLNKNYRLPPSTSSSSSPFRIPPSTASSSSTPSI